MEVCTPEEGRAGWSAHSGGCGGGVHSRVQAKGSEQPVGPGKAWGQDSAGGAEETSRLAHFLSPHFRVV